MSDQSRLDALELAVARLTRELVTLRSEVRRLREGGGAAGPAGADVGAPPRTTPSRDPFTGTSSIDREGDRSTANDREGDRAAAPEHITPATPATPAGATTPAGGEPAGAPPRPEGYVSDELRRILGGTGAGAGSSAPRTGSGHAAPRGGTISLDRRDVESLVGRYGTLALAALTILMGVGAFLGWAIRNGIIGPELRVGLGAVAAAAVAAFGWRLRKGSSPRFGDILLALSLAIVHVVCWGAGPLLHLVPDGVALGTAALASAALALLSLSEEEQSLFNVGVGGALLAPFVTASESGNPTLLLLYGTVVLGAGMLSLRDREWRKTPFVLMLGILWYALAANDQLHRDPLWPRATAPALFALGMAWLALLLLRGVPRSRTAHVALVAALGTLAALHNAPSTDWPRWVLAAIVTGTSFATSLPGERGTRSALLGAITLPLGALLVALLALPDATSGAGAATALLWAMGSAAAIVNRDGERGVHAFTATLIGGMVIFLPLTERDPEMAMALAAYAVAAMFVLRRFPLAGVALAAAGWLAVGTMLAFSLLDRRVGFITTPFLTRESAAAAAVSVAWLFVSWHASRSAIRGGRGEAVASSPIVRILGGVVTFFWIHQELASTVSPDVSTFLLIAYYALSGVVAIGVGRARAIPLLRQIGLALAVFAALKAIAEASEMAIGWRVAGYMLAGLFLLGVAYWYRATGRQREGGAGDGGVPTPEAEAAQPRS